MITACLTDRGRIGRFGAGVSVSLGESVSGVMRGLWVVRGRDPGGCYRWAGVMVFETGSRSGARLRTDLGHSLLHDSRLRTAASPIRLDS